MTEPGPSRRARALGWAGVVLVAAAWLLAAVWGSRKGYYPCYDSGAYVTVSRAVLAGHGYVEGNHPEKPPFILYPPGYVVPLSAAMRAFGEDWRALRLATAVPFGLAVILLVPWAFGRRFRPELWPLLAAILGSGSLYLWSLRIQAEPLYTLLALLAAGFFERAMARERALQRETGLAIAAAVLAIWTKPMGVMLPFAFAARSLGSALSLALAARRTRREDGSAPSPFAVALPPLLVAALLGAVVLAPFAVHLARQQPEALLPQTTHVLQKDWWNPDAGQRRLLSSENVRHLAAAAGDALRYYVPWSFLIRQESDWSGRKHAAISLLGWVVLLGVLRRLVSRRFDSFDWLAVGQVALICSMPNQHPRYYTVVAPSLCALFLDGLLALAVPIGALVRKFRGDAAGARLAPAIDFALAAALSLPLLAYEAGEIRGYRDWGEAWSDRSMNVFIGRAAAGRARPGDVLLVDDHYGIHALTGFPALSYHPAQRKSSTFFNAEEYLARGGRVDVVGSQVPEWKMARDLFERHGFVATEIEETDWWITARLVRNEKRAR